MNTGGLMTNPMVVLAGWTLVHFVWQGAAVAILLAVDKMHMGASGKDQDKNIL